MAQVSKYRYLLNQYPETVQKEQFRIICHISKRTARYLLQSGLVPCVQSGKKTRNYTIKMKDIVRYLERREIHPEKYKLPPGSYMEAPDRWADLGFANLLGRYEEAKAHNAPIAAERQRQADERRAQQDAREQQLAQERQARYDSAIREAEGNIMAGKEVINREINGKSLIMQLFREHEIPVPLKTQGWIINSLHSIRYDPQIGEWNYRYFKGSRNSTKMFDLLSKLSAAIQTRQQFEEHGMSPPDSPVGVYNENPGFRPGRKSLHHRSRHCAAPRGE